MKNLNLKDPSSPSTQVLQVLRIVFDSIKDKSKFRIDIQVKKIKMIYIWDTIIWFNDVIDII
jgi:hypothetical protein